MTEASRLEPLEVEVTPVLAIRVASRSGTDPSEISEAMTAAFVALAEFAANHPVAFAGPPRAIYSVFGPDGTEFTVAMPIESAPSDWEGEGTVTVGEIPGGKALRFTHVGPYPELATTYEGITAWMTEKGLLESDDDWEKFSPIWEEYVNDPESTPDEDLLTHIYVPVE